MTLTQFYKLHKKEMNRLILSALKEDRINSDITTNSLLSGEVGKKRFRAVLLCKEDCVLSGQEIFKKVYKLIDKNVSFKQKYKDGAKLKKGAKVLEVTASKSTLLKGERTALNFLQRMSGVATLTNEFVKKLKYNNSKILHTRKTTPNFRLFEIAAVKTGGGDFHRFDLSSSVMAKDNHIESLGSIKNIIDVLKKKNTRSKTSYIEIEVKTFAEIREIIKYGKGIVKRVMLDNFKSSNLDKAIRLLRKEGFEIEVSGGLNLRNFAQMQRKGINYYSLGALTHSYNSVDFSLEF